MPAIIKPAKKYLPKFKVEIEGVDVSGYVMDDTTLSLTTSESIGSGSIVLDTNYTDVISSIDTNNEIKIYLGYTEAKQHVFTGLIGDNETQGYQFRAQFADYGQIILQRTHTGVYRSDSATGNLIEILKTIILLECPELSYNTTTMPSTSEEFFRYAIQDRPINEIFDYICQILNRQWWVDRYKRVWVKTREFTDSHRTITSGEDITGDLLISKDTSKWANKVILIGRTYLVGHVQTETGNGITTEYTLDNIPYDMRVDITGATMTGSFTGARGYGDADYTVDQIAKEVEFATAPVSGDEIQFIHRKMVGVYETRKDLAAIRAKRRVDKLLPMGVIESQLEAGYVIQNYLDLYKNPLTLYSFRIVGTTKFNIGEKITLVDTGKSVNELCNVVGITHNFGTSGWTMDVQLNNFPSVFADMYAQLLSRIKRMEELDSINLEYITTELDSEAHPQIRPTAQLYTKNIGSTFIIGHATHGIVGTGVETHVIGDFRSGDVIVANWG